MTDTTTVAAQSRSANQHPRLTHDRLNRLGIHAAILTGSLLVWWLVSHQFRYVASPAGTVRALAEGVTGGGLATATFATLSATLAGFAIAVIAGTSLGYVLATNTFLGAVFDPIVQAYGSIPHVIFLPILLTLFGVGGEAKIAMAVVVALFPVVINVTAGVRAVPSTWVRLGRMLELGPTRMAFQIRLRGSIVSFVVGMRLAFGSAFLAVVISEFFGSSAGLGVVMAQAYGALDYDRLFAVVAIALAVALSANAGFLWLERRLAPA